MSKEHEESLAHPSRQVVMPMVYMERIPDSLGNYPHEYRLYCYVKSKDSKLTYIGFNKLTESFRPEVIIQIVCREDVPSGGSELEVPDVITITETERRNRYVSVKLILNGGGSEHDGTATIHPPDSDDD